MSANIVVTGLTKRYGSRTAVEDVGFEVRSGEIFGLLGPNGAGKTTILECLSGLRQPDSGSITVDGVDMLARPASGRLRLGVVLQSTALQDRITPREALRLFGAFYPAAVSADSLLARFSLSEKADAAYETLSAGQKQRLALALAFVHEPDVFLLDEPTAGLDPQARRELHQEIRRLQAEGRAVLLSTHALDEAHLLCDRLAILRGGKIVATGAPEELIARNPSLPTVVLRTAAPVPLAPLQSLDGISAVEPVDGGVQFRVAHVGRAVAAVIGLLESQGNELLDLRVSRPSLEDAFVELTREEIDP